VGLDVGDMKGRQLDEVRQQGKRGSREARRGKAKGQGQRDGGVRVRGEAARYREQSGSLLLEVE
jgi:hypothetical protein